MANSSDLHRIEEGTFESVYPEKTHIYFKSYFPKTALAPNAYHLIFQHGMIEYHKRHQDLFDALREHFQDKIVISCMDLYGHGKSGGDRGHVDQFSTFIQDYRQFLHILYHRLYLDRQLTPIFMSHSLGGLVTLKALSDDKLNLSIEPKSCIFVNPCLKPIIEVPKEAAKFLDNIPMTLQKVKIPLIYNGYDLSHDDQKARDFISDHLISKSITIKLGIETLKATKDINSVSYFFNYPSLFLLSGEDKVVENQKAELFYTGMDKKLAQKINYPKMRHDLLNETCRSEVFSEIIKYIEKTGLR